MFICPSVLAIANYSIKSNYPALLRGNQINEIINYMQFNFVFNTLIYLTKIQQQLSPSEKLQNHLSKLDLPQTIKT